MKMSVEAFRRWESKSITLLGMSGVGKTYLSSRLRAAHWFHYSADYRIGTRYLSEPILDNIKRQAMQVPFLRELLRSDSIYISNNITVDNLSAVLTYLGKLGNPARGGLPLAEFKHRQKQYRDAEVAAMLDVPEFIAKARNIYGYQHFINDSAGSLCELDDPAVLEVLAEHSLILYIEATEENGRELLRRAEADPKPLYLVSRASRTSIQIASCCGCSLVFSRLASRGTKRSQLAMVIRYGRMCSHPSRVRALSWPVWKTSCASRPDPIFCPAAETVRCENLHFG
jgi:hypothetical protein